MEKDNRQTGGCQCGALRYDLGTAPENVHACHCRMCQKATGGVFAVLAGAPKSDFRWTKGEPAFFASSNLAQRAFCRQCGTPLTFAYNDPKARIYVTMGSLDHPELSPIERQYGIESKLPFVSFCEELKQERTGEGISGAEEFYATMRNNQITGDE